MYKAAGERDVRKQREREKKDAVFSESSNNKEREKRVVSSSIMGGRVPEHRGEERTALLATKNKDDCVENGDRRRKIGGAR